MREEPSAKVQRMPHRRIAAATSKEGRPPVFSFSCAGIRLPVKKNITPSKSKPQRAQRFIGTSSHGAVGAARRIFVRPGTGLLAVNRALGVGSTEISSTNKGTNHE